MKYIFTAALLLSLLVSKAQPWESNLPNNKQNEIYSFFDYQKAFNEYWADKDIVNGYYYENKVKKKAFGWKQFKRWEQHWESRVNPTTGAFPTIKDYERAHSEFKSAVQHKSVSGEWTSQGPSSSWGGYAGIGRVNCIAFHPSNANTFWVGTPAGGLWKTTNGGSSWTVLTDDNDVLGVSAIIIPSDYATSNTLYIGTGDRDGFDNVSIGVLKSTDGGTTWNSTGLTFAPGDREEVNGMLIDPVNNNIIYAATTDGFYKTVNGGTSWSSSSYEFIDIELKPGSSTHIYGATTDGEIYRSTNSGSSFSMVYDGYSSGARRIELAVTADNSSYVYAVAANTNSGFKAILKSTNSGSSFSSVYSNLNLLGWQSDGYDSGGQGWYDLALAADPTDANKVYCGGVNTWRSTNGGTSWTIVNHWWGDGVAEVHADKHFLAFKNSTSKLYECNDGGVYSSINGTSWVDISDGIVNSQIYRLSTAQTVANSTLVGLQDNGSKLLKNNGSWVDVKGGDGTECLIDPTTYNTQYASYVYGQISRTTNQWNSSTDIEPSGASGGAWVTPFIIDPLNHTTLYAGYENVWKSTNQGSSWTQLGNINTSSSLRSMAIAASNNQVMYVADYNDIWKTVNGGSSWVNVTGSLPVSSSSLKSIAIKNNDPNVVWLTFSGYNSHGVYKTSNGGSNWSNISSGLPSIPVNTIIQNKQNTVEEELYVGTDFGVFVKLGISNWQLFNTGMPKVVVTDLDIYYANNPMESKLRAATFGRGLWQSDIFTNPNLVYDIELINVYALGDMPIGISSPEQIQAFVRNNGPDVAYGVDFTLNITGANTSTNVVSQSIIQPGDSMYVSFSNIIPQQTGTNQITVLCPSDEDNSNNDVSAVQLVTENELSHIGDRAITGSVGFGTDDGLLLAKYTANGQATINNIKVYITEGVGNIIEPVMLNSTGAFVGMGLDYMIAASDINTWVTLSFLNSITVNNNFFYVGIEQHSATAAYNPLGTAASRPGIADAFYTANVNGGNLQGPIVSEGIWAIKVGFCQLPDQPGAIIGFQSLCEGAVETYSTFNTPGLTYAWYLPVGWTGTSSTNTIDVVVGPNDGNIEVLSINTCGNSEARAKALTVYESLNIDLQPDSVALGVGNTASFEIIASGYNPTYQWKKDGVTLTNGGNIDGATSDVLELISITTVDAGLYSCEVSNNCGSIETETAELQVLNAIDDLRNNEIKVYPNPANNILNISADQCIDVVRVYAINGKLLKEFKQMNASKFSFNRANLPSGAYFIQIVAGNNLLNEMIVFE